VAGPRKLHKYTCGGTPGYKSLIAPL
jgi:hypothetical protein